MSKIQDEAYSRLCEEYMCLVAELKALRFALAEEQQTIDCLAKLCLRAADALECHNLDHLQDDLIAELRKAAE